MKIIKNEKHIKRNKTISNWLTVISVILIGAPIYVVFSKQSDIQIVIYAYIPLILGFMLMQVGSYMGNKYGRSPRPDEKLDAGLKGLQNEFAIYHYSTPASHLLAGPAGLWLLFPYHQRGQVTYKKNRWQMSGGGFMQGYMRIFGQEGIGRPDIEIESEMRQLRKMLAKHMDETEVPEINAMLVFTNDDVEIDSADAPLPALKLKQIKDFFRQKAKEKPIGQTQLAAVRAALPE